MFILKTVIDEVSVNFNLLSIVCKFTCMSALRHFFTCFCFYLTNFIEGSQQKFDLNFPLTLRISRPRNN